MIKPFLRSLQLLSPRHKTIFLSLLLARVANNFLDILGLTAIGLLGAMLASGLNNQQTGTFLGISVEIESSRSYFWIIVFVAVFFISKSLVGMLLLRISAVYLARVESRIAMEIASYLYSGGLSRIRRFSRGDVHFAVEASPNIAMSGLLMSGSAIVTESALFLSVFVVFLLVDALTALIISGYFILLVLIFQLAINNRLHEIGQRLTESSIALGNNIQDMTVAFREIAVLSKNSFFLDIFYFHRLRNSLNTALLSFLTGLPRFFVESALMVGVLALVGFQFLRGDASEGLVTTAVFLAGGFRMMISLVPIQTAVANIKTFGPQAELAQTLLVEARSSAAKKTGSTRSQGTVDFKIDRRGFAVSISEVTFTHTDSERPAVKSVTIDIPPGSFVAFIGPSGAGKTTLAELILGIYSPDRGQIQVAGQDPTVVREIHSGAISYVPQTPGLVTGTIADNVALGEAADAVDEQRIWEALEKAELKRFVQALPRGIHSELGKQADALSGGQKQRLGLARALYTNPRLLILDEATSALDATTEASVSKAIRKLGPTTTVVVIAHRLSTIQHADVVFVIEDGSLSAQGTFSKVRKQVPLIEEYVRLMTFDS